MKVSIRIPLSLLFLLCLCVARPAIAGVGNFCPFGTCVIETPTYVNVYWDSSLTQWDTDVAASSAQMRHDFIDALTQAVIRSDYFSALRQYDVRYVRFFEPGIAAGNCGAPPATIDQVFDQVKNLANCVLRAYPQLDPDNTILNVFLPPQTMPSSPNADFCKKHNGQHDKYGSPVEITIIPTNNACNSNLNGMFRTLTHEMVEAATDPVPASITGWKQPFWSGGGEIGDLCSGSTNFLFGQLTQYWSENHSACDNGFEEVFLAPWAFTTGVCGTGKAMQIAFHAADIGPKPWDLTTGSHRTMYLKAQISGMHTWEVGNASGLPADGVNLGNPDQVYFGSIQWTTASDHFSYDSTIQINGFDDNYGAMLSNGNAAVISPGDTITISVASKYIGQWGSVGVTAPSASSVGRFAVQPLTRSFLIVGQQASVSGVLEDGPRCGSVPCSRTLLWDVPLGPHCVIEGSPVTFSASAGTFSPQTTQSTSSGSFSSTYTAPAVAGMQTVGIQLPIAFSSSVAIHPSVTSLDPHRGAVSGGRAASIQGAGFVSGATSVNFEATNNTHTTPVAAQIQSVTSGTIQLTIPQSPLPGDGSGVACATVIANSVDSECLRYQYIVPGKPVLTFTWIGCDAGTIIADVYAADGSPQLIQVSLSARYNAFKDSSGHYVAHLIVASGQSVFVSGSGPVTVTNTQTPSLTVTESFPDLTGRVCPGSSITAASIDPRWEAFNPDLLRPLPVPPCTGTDCFDKFVVWASGKDALTAQPYVATPGNNPEELGRQFDVRIIGGNELRAYINANPFATARNVTTKMQVSFLGSAISVALTGHTPQEVGKLNEGWQATFPLPKGAQESDFRVLHLTKLGKVLGWAEEAKPRTSPQGVSLTVDIRESGVYALAHVVP